VATKPTDRCGSQDSLGTEWTRHLVASFSQWNCPSRRANRFGRGSRMSLTAFLLLGFQVVSFHPGYNQPDRSEEKAPKETAAGAIEPAEERGAIDAEKDGPDNCIDEEGE
jgi:hypothetical protein